MFPSPLRHTAAHGIKSVQDVRCLSSRRIIFSGIQPTGVPHLGNYLGALREWVKLQDEAGGQDRCFFSIVDLHAITAPQQPEQLLQWRKEMFVSLLAIGLDPSKSTIFCQSHVRRHPELMWILSCRASMGYLSRMTQWKSKAQLSEEASHYHSTSPLGLFSYPVLQAADVLLYDTTHVPVGEDQAQHLEFTRHLAASFNSQYGQILVEPQTLLSPAKRIMSLTDPTKKMSKSDRSPKSRILITDSRQTIFDKINGAVTDSEDGITYDRERRPGWANLIEIMFHLNDVHDYQSCEDVARDWSTMSKRVAKTLVASIIDSHLAPIRQRYHELMSPESHIDLDHLERRAVASALAFANRTMDRVKAAIGLQFGGDTLMEINGVSGQPARLDPSQPVAIRRVSSTRRVGPIRHIDPSPAVPLQRPRRSESHPMLDPGQAPESQNPMTSRSESRNNIQGTTSSIPSARTEVTGQENKPLPDEANNHGTGEPLDSNSKSAKEGLASGTRDSERSRQWLHDLYV